MLIGVPREIKDNENRVALTPAGVEELTSRGHQVMVEAGAGSGSGILDEEYEIAGAEIVDDSSELIKAADMIVKVKEPLPSEYELLRPGQILFTYLHLAAEPELTRVLIENRVTAIAYETIQLSDGSCAAEAHERSRRPHGGPSEQFLEKPYGGRGVLLGEFRSTAS